MAPLRHRCVIDRIEEHLAVLEVSGTREQLELPLTLLPAGCSEGDHLVLEVLVTEVPGDEQQSEPVETLGPGDVLDL